jgi:hypothetical protein
MLRRCNMADAKSKLLKTVEKMQKVLTAAEKTKKK